VSSVFFVKALVNNLHEDVLHAHLVFLDLYNLFDSLTDIED